MSQFSLLLNAHDIEPDPEPEGGRWTPIYRWCDDRFIHVGHGRRCAVFYAPLPDGLMPFWVGLRRVLAGHLSFDPLDFRVQTLAELAAAGHGVAAVDAISRALDLGLNMLMAHSVHLRDLVEVEQAKYRPVITHEGSSVVLRFMVLQLMVSVSPYSGDLQWIQQQLAPDLQGYVDLERLLPEWPLIQWRAVQPVGDLWRGDWVAETPQLRLHISGLPGGPDLQHEVLKRFFDVMHRCW